jgi:hypothetical protein
VISTKPPAGASSQEQSRPALLLIVPSSRVAVKGCVIALRRIR